MNQFIGLHPERGVVGPGANQAILDSKGDLQTDDDNQGGSKNYAYIVT